MGRRKTGGELLRKALEEAGVSQVKLEGELDVASGLVTRWINGQRVPSLEQAIVMRDKYGVPVDAWVQSENHATRKAG